VTDLAIPEPTAVAAADVPALCDAVMTTVAELDDIGAIDEMRKRLSMIDTYLEMTTIEGRSVIAATLRRIEVRIGKLLGPATLGANQHSGFDRDRSLSADQRSQFRKMAEYEDLVEEIIAESDDVSPASRRKTLDALRRGVELDAQEEALAGRRPISERPRPPRSDLWDLTNVRLGLEDRAWNFPPEHRPDVIDEVARIYAVLETIKEEA
jgi:hypothetical protein